MVYFKRMMGYFKKIGELFMDRQWTHFFWFTVWIFREMEADVMCNYLLKVLCKLRDCVHFV